MVADPQSREHQGRLIEPQGPSTKPGKRATGSTAMKRGVWQMIRWALGDEIARVDLVAPYPKAECIGRLRQHTKSALKIFDPRVVSGDVEETRFILWKAGLLFDRRGLHSVVRGTAVEEGQQTRLHCRFGIFRIDVIFMAIWFSVPLLIGGKTFVASVIAAIGGSSRLSLLQDGILGPAIGIGIGVIMVGIGRRVARQEQRFLLNFLIETLDGHEVPPSDEPRVDFGTVAAEWVDR